jgi:uncharacterized protein
MGSQMKISLVYAGEIPIQLRCELPDEATVGDAIQESGILRLCPEIDLKVHKIGVFGKLAKLDAPLRDGDRVEIYQKILRQLDDEDDNDDED